MLNHFIFKKFAAVYDISTNKSPAYWIREGFEESGRLEAQRVLLISDFIKSSARVRILDLGCGMGRLAKGLQSLGTKEKFHYKGVDVDKESLSKCKPYEDEFWNFHHFDMENEMFNSKKQKLSEGTRPIFPCEDSIFDIIYSWSVFSHLEPSDIGYYLELFHSLLSPKGMLFITFHENEKCEKNPTYNPEWWTYEGGQKLRENANKLLVAAYSPGWIKNELSKYKFTVLFKHYPIVVFMI